MIGVQEYGYIHIFVINSTRLLSFTRRNVDVCWYPPLWLHIKLSEAAGIPDLSLAI